MTPQKRSWKWLWWIVGGIIFILIAASVTIKSATNKKSSDESQVTAVALAKSPIKKITKTYQLSRDEKSLAVRGIDNKNKVYYFIYLPQNKKAYLYDQTEGISEKAVKKLFLNNHPASDKIKKINLGWYKKNPVWEISYHKKNDKLGYVIYSFKDGEELSVIDNL